MLITAIEKTKASRYSLFVEGEFALSVDGETLAAFDLKPGRQVSREDLNQIKERSDARRAREKALNLLSIRSHTRKELTDKLAKTVDSETACRTADRMEELGFLNDGEYARRFAAQLARQKSYGPARIRQKLYEKGIDRELAAQVLAELEEQVDQLETMRRLILRKYSRCLGDRRGLEKISAALARMGYSYSDIRQALAQLAQEEDALPWEDESP